MSRFSYGNFDLIYSSGVKSTDKSHFSQCNLSFLSLRVRWILRDINPTFYLTFLTRRCLIHPKIHRSPSSINTHSSLTSQRNSNALFRPFISPPVYNTPELRLSQVIERPAYFRIYPAPALSSSPGRPIPQLAIIKFLSFYPACAAALLQRGAISRAQSASRL